MNIFADPSEFSSDLSSDLMDSASRYAALAPTATDDDDTLDAVVDAERALLDRMRAAGMPAFTRGGKLYLDSFALAGERGGIVLDLDAIRAFA